MSFDDSILIFRSALVMAFMLVGIGNSIYLWWTSYLPLTTVDIPTILQVPIGAPKLAGYSDGFSYKNLCARSLLEL